MKKKNKKKNFKLKEVKGMTKCDKNEVGKIQP